jgi:hypothetical protein|tara:strand:- start:2660 stop:2956 length:297 start_codon:yes stop_codon:yes gene_type:complete
MEDATKKKLLAAVVAAVAAFGFGETQIRDLDKRIAALEEIHPELEQAELDELAEELKSTELPNESEEEKPSIEGHDHIKTDKDGDWVPAEEPTKSEEE